MARPPLEGINPLDIYLHARCFHVAEDALGKISILPDQQLAAQVVQPSMVISAFTTELFLKCLICIETTLTPQGHHLFELFEQLKPETQGKIISLWDMHIVPHREREWRLVEAHLRPQQQISRDLPGALSASSRAFEKIRYSYEPKTSEGSNFTIGDLPRVLRRVILEAKPEWTHMGRNIAELAVAPRDTK